ncbi:hypothetical protein [Mycobacterium sp. 050134]|uniref:hypothetical protein n=1 Tax=Mycobacterium sp. 050134 TaxID=3096111 RepID=UPI002ED930AA
MTDAPAAARPPAGPLPANDGQTRAKAPRSNGFRALIGASLAISLALGGALVWVDRLHSTPDDVLDHPTSPVRHDATGWTDITSELAAPR